MGAGREGTKQEIIINSIFQSLRNLDKITWHNYDKVETVKNELMEQAELIKTLVDEFIHSLKSEEEKLTVVADALRDLKKDNNLRDLLWDFLMECLRIHHQQENRSIQTIPEAIDIYSQKIEKINSAPKIDFCDCLHPNIGEPHQQIGIGIKNLKTGENQIFPSVCRKCNKPMRTI